MTIARDIAQLVGIVGKNGRDITILPGFQVGTTIYNAGLPDHRKITCINEVTHSQLPTAMFILPLAWPGIITCTTASAAVVTVSDSVQSGVSFFVTIHNAGLAEKEQIKGSDERHFARMVGPQAWPGISLGVMAGGADVLVVDTVRSFGSAFTYVYNSGLHPSEQITCISNLDNDTRDPRRIYGTGVIGVTVGGVAGGLSTVVTDSFRSMSSTLTTLYNLGTPEAEKIKSLNDLKRDSRPGVKIYGSGLLGIVAGGVISVPVIVVVDTLKTAGSISTTIYNAGLPDVEKMTGTDLTKDQRHPVKKYVSGVIGLLAGGVGGVAAIVTTDTEKTTSSTFTTIYNAGISEKDQITCINDLSKDPRHPAKKYVSGVIGLLAGGVGGVAAIVLTDTLKTTGSTFATIYNMGTPDEDQIPWKDLAKDKRHNGKKYISGGLGLPIGGAAALCVVGIVDTWKTTRSVFATVYNVGFPDHFKVSWDGLEKDKRHPLKIYGSGLPGLLIGGVTAVISILATDTAESAGCMYTAIYNAGTPDKDKCKWNDFEKDERHPIKQLGTGLFGLFIGAGIGIPVTVATDTRKTLWNVFATIYNLGTPTEDQTDWKGLEADQRHLVKKYVSGMAGLLVGGAAGVFATVLMDTLKTSINTYATTYNIGMPEELKIMFINDLAKDQRHALKRYGSGIVGLFSGGLAGVMAAFISDTVASAKSSFVSTRNVIMHEHKINNKYDLEHDNRHFAKIYITGVLGLLAGFTAAISSTLIYDNVKSATGVFASLVNSVLYQNEKITRVAEITDNERDQRHWIRKYGIQITPGLVGGALVGGIAILAILSYRFMRSAEQGWKELSRPLMNVALERSVFEGFPADNAMNDDSWVKIMGKGAGYIAAGLTTAIVGIATYLARKTPDVLITGAAVVASPLTAFFKLMAKCLWPDNRFHNLINAVEENRKIYCGFQSLYSSLDGNGKLKVGGLALGGDGSESNWSVFRKCLTLNAKTPTEVTLNAILIAFEKYMLTNTSGKAFFTGEEFKNTIKQVQDDYSSDWFLSQYQKKSLCGEVEDVAKFVSEYFCEEKVNVQPDFYTRRFLTFNQLFFGNRSTVKSENNELMSACEVPRYS